MSTAPATRPSLFSRILNRLYPYPLVRSTAERLAVLETELAALRQNADTVRGQLLRKLDAARWNTIDRLAAGQAPPAQIACILCGHRAAPGDLAMRESKCCFGGGRLVRHECPDCGAVFGPQKILTLTPEDLSFEYKELYAYYREGDSTEAELRAFRSLHPRKDGVYVNYGAGAWSQSTTQLRKEGYTVYAYEPYVDTPGEFLITTESQLRQMKFDGLYSNNVIEHFDDPVAAFKLMASVLKGPGSRMADHASPCYDYCFEFTRFHLIFFTGRSVEVLAGLSGLSVVGHERDVLDGVPYICHHFVPR